MGRLGRGERSLRAGKERRRLEDLRLLNGAGLNQLLVIEFRKRGTHAMVTQATRMGRRGNEATAQRVHLLQGADAPRIAEVIGIASTRKRRAARRLNGNDSIVVLTTQNLPHKRRNQARQVRSAARTSDEDIRVNTQLVQGRLSLKSDDGLVQADLVQDTAQQIAGIRQLGRRLDGLGNRTAERTRRAGMLLVDLAPDFRRQGGRRRHICTVGAHHLAAKRLLLIGALHHVDMTLQPKEGTRHRECRAPLTGARLGRHVRESLGLRIVRLGNGTVEFVRTGSVVALELVVDFGGRTEGLLKKVGTHERRRTIHLVEVAHGTRNRNVGRGVIEFLLHALRAEDVLKLLRRHRLQRRRIQERSGLLLHVRPHIVPRRRQLILAEVGLVRNLTHFASSFRF